eukprot:9490485-Pyramimonas_sp.AAC.1
MSAGVAGAAEGSDAGGGIRSVPRLLRPPAASRARPPAAHLPDPLRRGAWPQRKAEYYVMCTSLAERC